MILDRFRHGVITLTETMMRLGHNFCVSSSIISNHNKITDSMFSTNSMTVFNKIFFLVLRGVRGGARGHVLPPPGISHT